MRIWLFILTLMKVSDLSEKGKGDKVIDGSANGNNGTIHGGFKWVLGKFEGGLEFEASPTYIEVPNSDSLNPEEITIAAWVKIYNVANSKLIGKGPVLGGGLGPAGYLLGISDQGGLYPEINDKDKNQNFQFNQGNVPPNEWSHIALTYSMKDKTVIGYINAKEVGRTSNNGKPIAANTEPLIIGAAPWDKSGFPYKGVMDEVRIYKKPLEADEIKKVMESPLKAKNVEKIGKIAQTWGNIKVQY